MLTTTPGMHIPAVTAPRASPGPLLGLPGPPQGGGEGYCGRGPATVPSSIASARRHRAAPRHWNHSSASGEATSIRSSSCRMRTASRAKERKVSVPGNLFIYPRDAGRTPCPSHDFYSIVPLMPSMVFPSALHAGRHFTLEKNITDVDFPNSKEHPWEEDSSR